MAGAVSTLCTVCLHLDEMMEYKRGGVVLAPICMFGHAHFNLVKRYDQCRDFTDMNRQDADDADTYISEQLARPADCDYDRPGASASN